MTRDEPSAGPGPKTRRGQQSRARIVEAAVDAMLRDGVQRMRVDDVLAASGSSKSQMYHYFPDRDGLVEAAVASRCAEVLDALGPAFASASTLDELAGVLSGFADDYAQTLDGCPIGTLAAGLTAGPEPAHGLVRDAFARWEGHLADVLVRAKAAGELPAHADPRSLGLALLAALEGGMFLSQVRHDPAPLRVALDAALAHLRSLRKSLD